MNKIDLLSPIQQRIQSPVRLKSSPLDKTKSLNALRVTKKFKTHTLNSSQFLLKQIRQKLNQSSNALTKFADSRLFQNECENVVLEINNTQGPLDKKVSESNFSRIHIKRQLIKSPFAPIEKFPEHIPDSPFKPTKRKSFSLKNLPKYKRIPNQKIPAIRAEIQPDVSKVRTFKRKTKQPVKRERSPSITPPQFEFNLKQLARIRVVLKNKSILRRSTPNIHLNWDSVKKLQKLQYKIFSN